MKIYKPGVTVDMGRIPVLIIEALIKDGDSVEYRVVWFNGDERKCEWISSIEINSKRVGELGFIS